MGQALTSLATNTSPTRYQHLNSPRCSVEVFLLTNLVRIFREMSGHRLFSVVGDANVRRNMTGLNMASREVMKNSQVIDCDSMASLDAALSEVRPESTVLILASITEFLITGGFCGTIYSSIDPTLASFSNKINGFCDSRPSLQVNSYVFYFVDYC